LHAGQRREEPDSTTQGHADTSLIAVIIFFFFDAPAYCCI